VSTAMDFAPVGRGGISTAADAAVQVGTATFNNSLAMIEVIEGLDRFCEARGIARVADLTGALTHEEADEDDLSWVSPAP